MTPPASPVLTREQMTRTTRRQRYCAKRRELPVAPLRVGGWCIYLWSDDTRPMRVTAIAGGVVKVERDGRRFEEPIAKVRGLKLEGER